MISIRLRKANTRSDNARVSQEWCHIECPTIGGCIEMGSLDLTMGSDNLAGMSVRVFAFRKCIENDIHTRSDHG